MTQPAYAITDTSTVLAGGGTASVNITVSRSGSPVNLTGTNPTCTIRAAVSRETDLLLENVALVLVTPASGICRLDLTDAMLEHMSRQIGKPEQLIGYIAQVYVPEQSYYPNPFWLWVRAAIR